MTSVALPSVLQAFVFAGCVLTAGKLFQTGLHRHYRFFFSYIVFRILNSIWPLILDVRSDTYFFFYMGTLPIVMVFYVLCVRELYHLVLEDYRGLRTAGRWAMYVSLVGAILISIMSLIPKITPSSPQRSKVIGMMFGAERGVDTALAMFILLLLAFLSRYPIRLSRNVRGHAIIYSVFFLSGAFTLLVRAVFGLKGVRTWSSVDLILNLGCVLAWFLLFSPVGEKVRERRTSAHPENEKRLLLQLEVLNATLLRVSRAK